MSIRQVTLFHIAVPLKNPIRHASHARTESENLVVRVRLADGSEGFGEGVPRFYVTGETIDSAFGALTAVDVAGRIGTPRDYEQLVRLLESLTLEETAADPRGMFGNAARCALELAVLDAYGRSFGTSVGQAIRLVDAPGLQRRETPGRVRYSGAITADSESRERRSAWKMWLFNFAHTKVKVGVDGQDDPSRLARLRRIVGRRMDLRLDANEAWTASELEERVRPLLPYRPSALEQPVPHAEVEALAELRPRLNVPVMLDESLCGYPDGERAIALGTADLFNVRVSKCGGIIPTVRLMALAQRSGLGVQLGCHPGETGLLSAAGRHVASHVAGLRYVEGSYDKHVLHSNIIRERITFGYGGWAPPLAGPGLGVTVEPDSLECLTIRRQDIDYG